MALTEYMAALQENWTKAKAKAEVLVNSSDVRIPKSNSPVFFEDEFIPFVVQPTQHNLGVKFLADLNPSADFDITRTTANTYKDFPLPVTTAVVFDGEIRTVIPAKQQQGAICGIDWVSVTMSDVTFDNSTTRQMTSAGLRHHALVKNISATLTNILGFGIEKQNKNGLHFYETSYALEHGAGVVALGGQRNSVLIQLNGTGCDYSKHGWQSDLHAFLQLQAINPRITRLDLAHDDVLGEYNLAWFTREFDKGGFSNGSRIPNIEMRGNWKRPTGQGRTLYVGSSKSPRYCRIYEKGKQLGDPSSPWVRTEVQFTAKGIEIDLDALISPSNFFAMSYPCFKVFDKLYNYQQIKFDCIEKAELISFASAIGTTRHQFGRWINCFRKEFEKKGLTESDLLDMLTDVSNKAYPDKLDKLTINDFFKPKSPH